MTATTLQTSLESIVTHAPLRETREIPAIEVGQVIHQGDIYVHRVPDGHPRGEPIGSRKIAIGEGEGSRHTAEGDGVTVYAGVRMPSWVSCDDSRIKQALLGPVIVVETGHLTIAHPVHPHHRVVAGTGTYQVTYQLDARTRQRVQD